ncbi:CHAT domain-containing protein [Streptomyces chartreusis]|uniref:CHAT domain-containing protein n=1 Tax=Streptomyces chartreusis TaxID=1969 RepID=UPI00365476A4
MLWPAVYDLPVGGDTSLYEACPSVRVFGPEGDDTGPVPAVCPFEDRHSDNILCPFGFWGLSSFVEQPPPGSRDLRTVVHHGEDHVALLAAVGSSLDQELTALHVNRLRAGPPSCRLDQPVIGSEDQLVDALGPEAMDVVYFYCHCGYDRRSDLAAADRYLDFGSYSVRPVDVTRWARGRTWEYPHWPRRSPLVVLNGCHTTEANSGTLNGFVRAFTEWAGASGVVGTEVVVEQGLAGWAMEQLFAHLLNGASVASALRSVRWNMLRRGNVMGLAYTAHCLADLSLRPPATNQE